MVRLTLLDFTAVDLAHIATNAYVATLRKIDSIFFSWLLSFWEISENILYLIYYSVIYCDIINSKYY